MNKLIFPGVSKAVCLYAGKRLKLTIFAGLTILSGVGISSTQGAVWYLQNSLASGQSITTPGFWYTTPTSGTGTPATSFNASDIYDTNGKLARTNSGGMTSFEGGTLISSGGNAGVVALKGLGITVANFQTAASGGSISNSEGGVTFTTTTMTLNGDLTLGNNGRVSAEPKARTMSVSATTLTGSGNMTLYGGPTGFITLGFGDASGYTGTIFSTDEGFIDFGSSFATNGGLSLAAGTRVQSFDGITVSFTSLNIAGTIVGPGTYSFADLRAIDPLIFNPSGTGGVGFGTIIVVPEPSTWMLIGAAGTFLMVIRLRRATGRETV